MRLAIISDTHLGNAAPCKGINRKLSGRAPELLERTVRVLNEEIHPDAVIQLGDLIEGGDAVEDRASFRRALGILSQLKSPLLHVAGNHDQEHLDNGELSELLGGRLYYSMDIAGFHLIVLFARFITHSEIHVDREQIEWLKQDLASASKPVIVFSHYAILDQDLKGNFWWEDYPKACFIHERCLLRDIFESCGRVKAVFCGHIHWNRAQAHRGIAYVTIQSLVENLDNRGLCSETFAVCDFSEKGIEIRISGKDPAEFSFGIPAADRK